MFKSSILLIGFVFLFASSVKSEKKPDRPNILFLVVEDTSPYLFPAYGNKSIKTPNLDFIAQNGVVFNNAFSNGPQCSPARSSLISGSYATTYACDWHRNGNVVPQQYFFPQYMRQAGYFCVNAGKTDYNITRKVQKQYYPVAWNLNSSYIKGDVKNASYNDSSRGDKPFFAQFNNPTTHMSRMTTVSIDNRKPTIVDPNTLELPPHVPDLPEVRSDYALHMDGVVSADKWVGLFLDDLRQRDLLENTIIFFFSDHGGCLPRGKAFPYETGFRPALMVYAPEKWQHLLPEIKGQHTDRIVEFVDFAPTLLSIAGVKSPEHIQGKAFMGEFSEEPRDFAYCFRTNTDAHFDPSRSVLDGDFQYIKYYMPYKVHALKQAFQWGMPSQIAWDSLYHHGGCLPQHKQYFEAKPTEMLFDSKNDPYGMNNLVEHPEYSHRLQLMRAKVSEHIRETKDIGFLPKEVRDDFVTKGISLYEWIRSSNYPLDVLHELVEKASVADNSNTDYFIAYLSHERPEIRFWAASGLANLAHDGKLTHIPAALSKAVNDDWKCVQATAAEAMVYAGKEQEGMKLLIKQAQLGSEQALSALEELGERVKPFMSEIKEISETNKNGNVRFMARGILINMNELPMSKLFEKKNIDSFLKGHEKRVKQWAPTRP